MAQLLDVVRPLATGKKCLLQRAIPLIRDEKGCLVDFRWLLQKDGEGHWSVIARVARLGTENAITTNLHTGGAVILAETMLSRCQERFGWPAEELCPRMDALTLQVARALDIFYGPLGELGIDLGIDTDGRIWFIEANPRPGRKMLRMVAPALRRLSLLRSLEYSRYATGFSESHGG